MPTSSPVVITEVVAMVAQVDPAGRRRVLDVGPGYGKYGLLLREMLNEKPARLDAIEAHAQYVLDFPWLSCIYDDVHIGDVCDRSAAWLASYDLVLMADVLEHIEATRARDLLAAIPGRVVISTPNDFFDTGPGLPATEAHVSHWPTTAIETVAADTGHPVEVLYVNHVGAVLARLGPQ